MSLMSACSILWLVLLLCQLLCIRPSCSLYWILQSTVEEKCFIEEVPAETLVLVTYTSLDHTSLADNEKLVVVNRDPFHGVISEQVLDEPNGKIAFTSEHSGDHSICFAINGDNNGINKDFKMEIHIDSGEHAHDYNKLARVEHLSTIEVELRRLNDKIRSIRNEQQYQKRREEEFRDTSEATNTKVVWWSIFQTFILVLCGLFQIWHLRRFFTSKKLV